MDSFALPETYKRYKNGTGKIAKWLVETAKACKVGLQFLGPTAEATGAEQINRLSLSAFSGLSEAIAVAAYCGKKVSVPETLLATAQETIRLRKEASECYLGLASDDDTFEEQNAGHLHFIEILEEVYETLQSFCEPSQPVKKVRRAACKEKEPVPQPANIYQALEVENAGPDEGEEASTEDSSDSASISPGDDIESTPSANAVPYADSPAPPSPSTSASSEELYEVYDDSGTPVDGLTSKATEDLYFAVYCFLKDVHRIEVFLLDTWIDYREKTVSLATASAVTDMAIEIVKLMEQQFISEMREFGFTPQPGEEIQLGAMHFEYHTGGKGKPTWEASQESYYGTATFLQQIVPGVLAVCRSKHEATLDPECCGIPPEFIPGDIDQLGRDLTTVSRYVWDVYTLMTRNPKLPFVDCMTEGMYHFLQQNKRRKKKKKPLHRPPVWLCFGLQVLINIYHVMIESQWSPVDELVQVARRSEHSIANYLRHFDEKYVANPANFNYEMGLLLAIIQDASPWIDVADTKSFYTCDSEGVSKDHPARSLFYYHPIITGLLQLQLQISMSQVGITVANAHDNIIPALQVYNAFQKHYCLPSWPAMEELVKAETERELFYGGRPTTTRDFLIKFELAAGRQLKDFHRDCKRHDSPTKMSQRNDSRLRGTVLATSLLAKRYGAMCQALDFAGQIPTSNDTWTNMKTVLQRFQKVYGHALPVRSSGFFGFMTLLSSLRHGMGKEEKHLQFDYFGHHVVCSHFLEDLQDSVRNHEIKADEHRQLLATVETQGELFTNWNLSSFLLNAMFFNPKMEQNTTGAVVPVKTSKPDYWYHAVRDAASTTSRFLAMITSRSTGDIQKMLDGRTLGKKQKMFRYVGENGKVIKCFRVVGDSVIFEELDHNNELQTEQKKRAGKNKNKNKNRKLKKKAARAAAETLEEQVEVQDEHDEGGMNGEAHERGKVQIPHPSSWRDGGFRSVYEDSDEDDELE